jgi:hypothetical protein
MRNEHGEPHYSHGMICAADNAGIIETVNKAQEKHWSGSEV